MLNDYLQFAKTQSKEKSSSINLANLFDEIKREINNENFNFEIGINKKPFPK